MLTYLFIILVTNSVEIAGYAVVDILLMTVFFATRSNYKISIPKLDLVTIFICYMILQVFRGLIVLLDFRILYWLIFFIVIYSSHRFLGSLLKKNLIGIVFVTKVFNYCVIYFAIYGSLPILFRNPDVYQGIYWVGSSSAFIIIIPFVCSHFILYAKSNFSLLGLRAPYLLLVFAVSVIHYSRMGMYLILIYLFCLAVTVSFFRIRRMLGMCFFLVTTLFTLSVTETLYYEGQGGGGLFEAEIEQIDGVNQSGFSSLSETSNDISRFIVLLSVYDKITSSTQELLFGSGWYTSRFTLQSFELINVQYYGAKGDYISKDKAMQVSGLPAFVSDTGLIGLFFIMYFFAKSAAQIYQSRSPGRKIIILFLFSNFIFYLVGNPFISIISLLMILPNGLLVCLARASSLTERQNNVEK